MYVAICEFTERYKITWSSYRILFNILEKIAKTFVDNIKK